MTRTSRYLHWHVLCVSFESFILVKLLDYFALGILTSRSCKWLTICKFSYSYAASLSVIFSFPMFFFSLLYLFDCDDTKAKHFCLSCTLFMRIDPQYYILFALWPKIPVLTRTMSLPYFSAASKSYPCSEVGVPIVLLPTAYPLRRRCCLNTWLEVSCLVFLRLSKSAFFWCWEGEF